MHPITKIIVGVEMPDARPWSADNITTPVKRAVRQAFEVASALNAAIQLVCVLPEVTAGFFGSETEARAAAEADRTTAMAVMAELELQFMGTAERPVDVSSTVEFGRPWLQMLKLTGGSRDCLIICGTRNRGAVSRMLFGSTGQKLLRNAVCPVWLVKPRIDEDADVDVLAATDLSEVGLEVLQTAVFLGQHLPVRLTALHVVDDDLDRHMARSGVSENEVSEYRQKNHEAGETRLHEQLALTDYRTLDRGVQAEVVDGPADSCILSAIEQRNIDLLIMATSGRGGIPGMLFGNTAERLLPEIPCSILAIKPDDFECPVALG